MRGAVLYGPRDVRIDERPDPTIIEPTDAVIRLSATCICGSDLWPYRGLNAASEPAPMGHEYCGIVEEVGRAVTSIKPGQFVIGSFAASDNTCPHCRAGYQTSCAHRQWVVGAQAPFLRVPLADGTLVATQELPSSNQVPSFLAVSDVLGTGWFAADAANVKPGATVVVVGDGAVGLLGVLSAKQMGAERIIAMSRHEARQTLAREFGATDIVTERGDEGVERVKELTKGVGADSVLECVGTQESMMQAIHVHATGWIDQLCRGAARRRTRRREAVLHARASARWPRAGAPLPSQAHSARAERDHQSRQGLRSRVAARASGRGLSSDGRAPRHQDAAASIGRRPHKRRVA